MHRDTRASKEEILTECPQIFAALMYEDGLQKLVKLLLVTSKYCQRKCLLCMHRRIHLCPLRNCTCDLNNVIDDCLS